MAAFSPLKLEVLLAIHEEQIAVHGGGAGIRDLGALESALARPENKMAYDTDADCASTAAAYASGIARNHPFVDGNKRTAFVAMELCLARNGYGLAVDGSDAVVTMLRLAAGELSEDQLATWVREHLIPNL